MIRNYIKVALRSIFRNRLTSFINIAGLALAMACTLLIALFVTDELSYEQYHAKADRIYRINRTFRSQNGEINLQLANVAPPIGPLLKNDFGEIEALARTLHTDMLIGLEENGTLKHAFNEENLYLAEPAIFDIFDITVSTGNRLTALSRPFTVMLSEKTAAKYFGDHNPVGKRLRANEAFDLEVTGIYKDFPRQSHWHPEFLVSFATLEDDNIYGRQGLETNWGNNAFGTYVLLQEGANAQKLAASLPAFLDKHFGNFARSTWGVPADWVASKTTSLHLQKVTDIHLRSHLDDELEANGDINTVYMMSIIGLFIVLIACFNFVNLSTARATKRAKEVGLRKVVGALKQQLIGQYLSESILIACFALVLGFMLASIGVQWLNTFTNKALSLHIFIQWPYMGILMLFTLLTGVLAGLYPAFVMTAFDPVRTLKGQQTAQGKGLVRKALVVFQFSISIALIIATLVTFQQLSYLNNRALGYDKDRVIALPLDGEVGNSFDAFAHTLAGRAGIEAVGRSSRIPTGRLLDSYGSAKILRGDSLTTAPTELKSISVDEWFFEAYGIEMVAGRNFSAAVPTDDSLAFIVNAAAAQAFGWTTPAQHIDQEFHYAGVRGKLIGVVNDFHFESLHQPILPMIFLKRKDNFNWASVRVAAGASMQDALEHLETTWKSFAPGRPFTYNFVSERYKRLYEAEQKRSQLFTTFAALAIFIASLGLFGLATFNTLQRMKEIGIRKVLGASVPNILRLLSSEIVILIVAANVLAWPAAWYFMRQWLENFAYRIDLQAGVFIVSALGAVIMALLTVSVQTVRAALKNPATTLRYE